MTDEELHWEPAPGMWGYRRRDEVRTPLPDDMPPGDWWFDSVRPRPDPEPFTTVAWRVAHLTLGTWNWLNALAQRASGAEPCPSGVAEAMIGLWKQVLDDYVEMVCGFTEGDIREEVQVGANRRPRSGVISHVTLEIAFHSSEVGTLRHLYRATR